MGINLLLRLGWGMQASVLTSPSTIICLAVASITPCLLSKQKTWSVSHRSFETFCIGSGSSHGQPWCNLVV